MNLGNAPLLIIEDNPHEVFLFKQVLSQSAFAPEIDHCFDGDTALDYLFRRGDYQLLKKQLPGLVVLDLNMPGTAGKEVLAVMKQDPRLQQIPVVILTTSDHEDDIQTCYKLGANSYVQKPVDFEDYFQAVAKFASFWLEVASIPAEEG